MGAVQERESDNYNTYDGSNAENKSTLDSNLKLFYNKMKDIQRNLSFLGKTANFLQDSTIATKASLLPPTPPSSGDYEPTIRFEDIYSPSAKINTPSKSSADKARAATPLTKQAYKRVSDSKKDTVAVIQEVPTALPKKPRGRPPKAKPVDPVADTDADAEEMGNVEGGAFENKTQQYVDPLWQTSLLIKLASMIDDATLFFEDNIKPYAYLLSIQKTAKLRDVRIGLQQLYAHFTSSKFSSNAYSPRGYIFNTHEEGNGQDIVENFEDALNTLIVSINAIA